MVAMGNMKPDSKNENHIDKADECEWNRLAENEFGRGDGCYHDLLHGTDFFFTDHRHAGEHQGDQHDNDGNDAGHIKITAFQVFIEPCPFLEIDLYRFFFFTLFCLARQRRTNEGTLFLLFNHFYQVNFTFKYFYFGK